MPSSDIRKLDPQDVSAYQDIRLEALKNAPTAFGSSYEEEHGRATNEIINHISNGNVYGYFIDGGLIGITGGYVFPNRKSSHVVNVWGVYVKPDFRRQGISKLLFSALADNLPDEIEQLRLSVESGNEAAMNLYKKLGFNECGREEKVLKIDGQYYDEILMVKFLK